MAVPWARSDSGFTLLFEALVVLLAKSMPVLAVARFVDEHDTLVWRIVTYYVDSARAKADHSMVTQVGSSTTSRRIVACPDCSTDAWRAELEAKVEAWRPRDKKADTAGG